MDNKKFVSMILSAMLLSGCMISPSEQLSDMTTCLNTTTSVTQIATQPTQVAPVATQPEKELWNPESGGIYDVSAMIPQIDGYCLSDVLAEQQLLIYKDIAFRSTIFVPFKLSELKAETENQFALLISSNTKIHIRGSLLHTWRDDYLLGEGLVEGYDILNRESLLTWKTKDRYGYSNTGDAVLFLHTDENQQRIYQKNLLDGYEKELLRWDITDKTVHPILHVVTQGESGFAFVGNIYTAYSPQSVLCCGFIDNNGKMLQMKLYSDEYRITVYRGGVLVQNDILGFDSVQEPDMYYQIFDANTLSIKKIQSQDPKCRISISDNGQYLIAYKKEGPSFHFWVYDMIQGQLLKKAEYTTAIENIGQYSISISEKENGFLLLLRHKNSAALLYFAL